MNIMQWFENLKKTQNKKPFPILSFPSAGVLGVSVYDLTHDAELQARGIKLIADRTDSAASVGMMDLSVEAEAFGCMLKETPDEVPTVLGALIAEEDEARELAVPAVGAARTGLYLEAVKQARELISDRPVFAGMLGPFSLAGRLMDVSEALTNCIIKPELVHVILKKATQFLIEYAKAYKKIGAQGVFMAEPLAGLLSPAFEAEFSAPFVKQIAKAVQDDTFAVIYHNCGPNVPLMTESLANNGAAAYHFGDAVDLEVLLQKMPSDKIIFGNISPSNHFLKGTPEEMYIAATELLTRCSRFPNFVLSSGCDIPPASPWKNIDAFFAAFRDFYTPKKGMEP